ncbi:Alpha/beta hydrolase [Halomicronema hongdechloris C2206]|uniref:Alpha/beta hydrolase n=1 Tax=Halomicronema hongdechloris C2206 TaxID=1641165 RepID=A0A1Z3HI64_9CYAN|nr:alpha/beta hydrolase [Halomicronema hongdechloris]ASC70009.1 Alpha/beta hydrolase [Halomicronema hongdechloris C2206]
MTALVPHWQHQFIETNRVRLHCVTQGEGELVILLHSFFEFWYSWRFQLPTLARHYRVVVPDLRGCNDSDKPDSGYDLDTLSQDIWGLIEGLGYQRAHIVGHAWGGTIGWHLAQTMPDAIQQLAILNGAPSHQLRQALLSNVEQIRRSWQWMALQLPALPEWLIEQSLPTFVKNFFQMQAVRKGAFSIQDTQLLQAALSKPGAIAAALKHYRHCLNLPTWLGSWWQSERPIEAPTLVLWGEDDTVLSSSMAESMAQWVSGSFQVKQIPQCGHWSHQEAPHLVNRELLRFLCNR